MLIWATLPLASSTYVVRAIHHHGQILAFQRIDQPGFLHQLDLDRVILRVNGILHDFH